MADPGEMVFYYVDAFTEKWRKPLDNVTEYWLSYKLLRWFKMLSIISVFWFDYNLPELLWLHIDTSCINI